MWLRQAGKYLTCEITYNHISCQILDVDPEVEQDGANQDLDSMRKGKCAITVIKTSTRQTVFLPLIGLVPAEKLTPGDLIGVNKDSYLVLDALPAEFDNRVKAMEVDERLTETYRYWWAGKTGLRYY